MSRVARCTYTRVSLALAFTLLSAGPVARAATGGAALKVSHSGYLLDGADHPLSGSVEMKFRVYDAQGFGTLEWEGACGAVAVRNGYYTLVLGGPECEGSTANGLDPTLDTSDLPPTAARWLEAEIGGNTLSPRMAFHSVPTADVASRALNADAVGGQALAALHDATKLTGVAPTATLQPAIDAARVHAEAQLAVEAAARVAGDAAAVADARLSSNVALLDAASTSFGGSLRASNGFTAWNGSTFAGGATVNGGLTVNQAVPGNAALTVNGALKAAGGLDVTGDVRASGRFSGDGSQLTNLAAAALVGTLDPETVPTLPFTKVAGGTLTVPSGSAPGAAGKGALYFDDADTSLKVHDGTGWVTVGRASTCGETQLTAARSCRVIKDNCPGARSKAYFLDPDGPASSTVTPFEVFCDMSTSGGGWALFAKLGESYVHNASSTFDVEVAPADLATRTNPGGSTFSKLSLARFNAWGSTWTMRAQVDSFQTGNHYQYTFWRPKTGASLTPGVAGQNWKNTDTDTRLVALVMSSTSALNNATWMNIPVFDLAGSYSWWVFSWRRGDLASGQCVDGNGQTVVCHCPAGSINPGLTSGTHTACFGHNDGVTHAHGKRAFYWIRDTNDDGTP